MEVSSQRLFDILDKTLFACFTIGGSVRVEQVRQQAFLDGGIPAQGLVVQDEQEAVELHQDLVQHWKKAQTKEGQQWSNYFNPQRLWWDFTLRHVILKHWLLMIRTAQLLLEEQRERVFEVPKEKKMKSARSCLQMLKFAVLANIQLKDRDGPGSGGRPDVGWVSPCCYWQLRACLNLFWEFGERSPPEEGGACGLRRRLGAAHTHPSGVSAELTAFSLLRRALCVPRQCLSDSWIGSLLQWASVCEDLGKRWDGGRGTLLKGKARGSSATVLWNAWNPLTEGGPFHALEVDIHLYFPLAVNLIVKFISLLISFNHFFNHN